jgi:hypothetical protein
VNAGAIKGTVGSGGIGILMLSIASLDAMHVHFWVAFTLALLPAAVFILAEDFVPTRSLPTVHAAAAGAYFLLALLSLSIAIWRGFTGFDAFFLGFILLGAWPCALALRRLRGPEASTADRKLAEAQVARQRAAQARAAHGGSLHYKASRKKAVLLFLGCAAFVAIGVLAVGEKPWLGWACILFFGLGLLVSLLMMLPGSTYLKLDERGFEMSSLYRRHRLRWDEVDGFGLAAVADQRMIAIAYNDAYRQQAAARRLSSAMTGLEGAIPNHYEAPIEEIIEALLAWKTRAQLRNQGS